MPVKRLFIIVTRIMLFSSLLILLFVGLTYARPPVQLEGEIAVYVDDQRLDLDIYPALMSGRLLVPFRSVAEALGAKVNWDKSTRTVTATLNDTEVKFMVDAPFAQVNGKEVELEVPSILLGGRTLIPFRFFAESFGSTVEWDGSTYSVKIISPKQ